VLQQQRTQDRALPYVYMPRNIIIQNDSGDFLKYSFSFISTPHGFSTYVLDIKLRHSRVVAKTTG
jgi:hypothetical protein